MQKQVLYKDYDLSNFEQIEKIPKKYIDTHNIQNTHKHKQTCMHTPK